MRPEELADFARTRFPDIVLARDEVTIFVERAELLDALAWLRDEPATSFRFLSSVNATDWPGKHPRFWLSYDLRSIELRHRIRVKVGLAEEDAHVPSVTPTFPTADWHERELYDLFGIVFDGHPNLSRILLPDDWEGFPLRKTEELGGVMTRYKGALVPPIDKRGMA